MKEDKKEKVSFLVSEGNFPSASQRKGLTKEQLKKPLVFAVMGIIFAACLYLILAAKKG